MSGNPTLETQRPRLRRTCVVCDGRGCEFCPAVGDLAATGSAPSLGDPVPPTDLLSRRFRPSGPTLRDLLDDGGEA